jgi:hypothetical protein
MPVISAFADHPTHPYVRVEINWADVPSATQAGVSRVDVATGECTPLRPYVCYDGWELVLSCGHGTFWDTEAPFDRPFYYITTSSQAPCVPLGLAETTVLYDDFNRTVVNGFGTPTFGPAYTLSGGTVPGDYDVNPGFGEQTLASVDVRRLSMLDAGTPNQDITATTSVNIGTPAGASAQSWLAGRLSSPGNFYLALLSVTTTGAVDLNMYSNIGGVLTQLAPAPVVLGAGHVIDERWTMRLQVLGSSIKAKAWLTGNSEPDWQISVTDTGLTSGNQIGLISRLAAGSGNAGAVTSWENLIVNECPRCVEVTADTSLTPITLVNDGRFWLKDPVRPCHDRPVPLCPMDGRPVVCGGSSGILFIGMGPEVYTANSFTMRPMNRSRTISATRPRGDATTALRLQTMTFTDRDELLALAAPGSLLLFQGPAEYGIPDRYMDVKDVQVSPELPDLRIQIRTEVLPYEVQDRPAGPSQGICGARVADICAEYPTWGDLAATGMTWDDLVGGQASPESANPNQRTWDDVNADFADWDDVNTGGRTWSDLQAGN